MRIFTLVFLCLSTYVVADNSNYSSCCGNIGVWDGISEQKAMSSHSPQAPGKSAEFYTKGGEIGNFNPGKKMEEPEKSSKTSTMANHDPFDGYVTDY